MRQDEILAFDCELTVYRKGSITVHFDLQQRYFSWRESRQWCNNFIRSLTDEQIMELRQLFMEPGVLEKHASQPATPDIHCDAGHSGRDCILLTINCLDRELIINGEDLDQAFLKKMRRQIEKLSRVQFRL